MGILSFVFSPRQVYVYGESGLKAFLPPFTDRWTEDPVGIGTARHPYVRLNDSSPSAGPHLLQARIVSGDVWLVAVLIVLGC